MAELSDQALLLRRIPYGDTSLICHFLTRQHGRIPLMVRGARRAKSPFRAPLAPLYHLHIRWRPGRTGMGTIVDVERGERLIEESLDLEGMELISVAAGLFQEGDPHGYTELLEATVLMRGREPRTGLLAAMWKLLHDGGWVGDLQHCWQCGSESAPGEAMAWQGAELVCSQCGGGMEISAGMRKGMLAQYGSSHVRMAAGDLSGWQKMIQDVLRVHGIRSQTLFQER